MVLPHGTVGVNSDNMELNTEGMSAIYGEVPLTE